VAVTGQKAAEILLDVLASPVFGQTPDLPKVGGFVPFDYGTRKMKLHRMPFHFKSLSYEPGEEGPFL